MIEPNNPKIDVDSVMAKIRSAIATHHTVSSVLPDFFSSGTTQDASANAAGIEALLRLIEEKAQVRTRWSGKLNRFPFTLSRPLQGLLLKGLAFLFKDQRHVNLLLMQALRETLWLNQRLIQQMDQLRRRLNVSDAEVEKIAITLAEMSRRYELDRGGFREQPGNVNKDN